MHGLIASLQKQAQCSEIHWRARHSCHGELLLNSAYTWKGTEQYVPKHHFLDRVIYFHYKFLDLEISINKTKSGVWAFHIIVFSLEMIICKNFNNFLEKFYAVYLCNGNYAYQQWLIAYKVTVYNTDQGRQMHSNLEISRKAVLWPSLWP